MKKTLLIDIGSTSIKWVVKSELGYIKSINKQSFPKQLPLPDLYFEVDINEIVSIVKSIIDLHLNTCENVLIATQMHGYILSDCQMQPVTNYISWQDQRAKNIVYPFELPPTYGTSIKVNLPKVSVYYMQLKHPECMQKVAYFDTLGSYIIYQLTGKHITHITDAAASGFYNIIEHSVDKTPFKLPEAVDEMSVIGKYKALNIYPPVGDQQASIYSLEMDDSYILNLGTAAQMCCINYGYIEGNFESRPYFNRKTLCTITNLFGGKGFVENYLIKEHEIYVSYAKAMKRLPNKKRLIVMGGTLIYHLDKVQNILNHCQINVQYDKQAQALRGLAKLAEDLK